MKKLVALLVLGSSWNLLGMKAALSQEAGEVISQFQQGAYILGRLYYDYQALEKWKQQLGGQGLGEQQLSSVPVYARGLFKTMDGSLEQLDTALSSLAIFLEISELLARKKHYDEHYFERDYDPRLYVETDRQTIELKMIWSALYAVRANKEAQLSQEEQLSRQEARKKAYTKRYFAEFCRDQVHCAYRYPPAFVGSLIETLTDEVLQRVEYIQFIEKLIDEGSKQAEEHVVKTLKDELCQRSEVQERLKEEFIELFELLDTLIALRVLYKGERIELSEGHQLASLLRSIELRRGARLTSEERKELNEAFIANVKKAFYEDALFKLHALKKEMKEMRGYGFPEANYTAKVEYLTSRIKSYIQQNELPLHELTNPRTFEALCAFEAHEDL